MGCVVDVRGVTWAVLFVAMLERGHCNNTWAVLFVAIFERSLRASLGLSCF
jgi:hypothetical protein